MSLSSIHGRYRLAKFLRISLSLGVFGVAALGSIEAANLASITINIPRIGGGSVVGGTAGTATATLSAAAPQGGVTVQVLSNNPAAAVQNIQIPGGRTTGTSTITTQPVTADVQVTLSGRVAPSEPLETKAPFLTQSFQGPTLIYRLLTLSADDRGRWNCFWNSATERRCALRGVFGQHLEQ